jgi:hypothetical protein
MTCFREYVPTRFINVFQQTRFDRPYPTALRLDFIGILRFVFLESMGHRKYIYSLERQCVLDLKSSELLSFGDIESAVWGAKEYDFYQLR